MNDSCFISADLNLTCACAPIFCRSKAFIQRISERKISSLKSVCHQGHFLPIPKKEMYSSGMEARTIIWYCLTPCPSWKLQKNKRLNCHTVAKQVGAATV